MSSSNLDLLLGFLKNLSISFDWFGLSSLRRSISSDYSFLGTSNDWSLINSFRIKDQLIQILSNQLGYFLLHHQPYDSNMILP